MSKSYSVEENKFLRKIGANIKKIRTEAGFSQEDVAFRCELDRTYVGSVERGERNISILNLRKLAKALSVHTNKIIEIDE